MTDEEKIAADIEALSPPDKLRVGAFLLEQGKPELAHAIVEKVSIELGAALALRKLDKAGTKGK